MKARDLAELATRNLRESKLRNSLTTLGISVGIASLVAMLSLGIGLQELAGKRLSRSGLFDTIVVYSRRDVAGFDRAEARANRPRAAESRALDAAARSEFEKLPDVVEVYPEIRFTTEVRIEGRSQFTMVAGLPMSSRENDAFDTLQGKHFSAGDADEAILQAEFAGNFGAKPAELIGKELILRYAERQPLAANGDSAGDGKGKDAQDAAGGDWGFSVVRREKKLRIVGIVEDEPYGGWRSFARGRVFLPIELAEKMNTVQYTSLRDAVRSAGEEPTYTSLLVRVTSPGKVQPTQDAIKKAGFTTWSILDATRNLRRFFAIVDLFLGIFGSLAVVVASLGIMNTLVMAVLERRREIGILKALGASDADVKRLFFAEAGAMGLAGGLLGVAMGWGIGRIINFGTEIYLRRQELPAENVWLVPWWLVLGAVGFALVVSLVSGLYPAARAAKLDPVQALRYE
jgi:putative ABC transport system permease protein